MNDYEIIDAHIHLSRSIVQEKESWHIPGRRDRHRWGNADSVTAYMDHEGISKIVSLNVFPTDPMRQVLLARLTADVGKGTPHAVEVEVSRELANRLRRHNEWICQLGKQNPRIVPGIGIQKLLTPEEMVEEVKVRVAQGAKTVKLVPGMCSFYPNDHDFWPMYEACQNLGIAVTSDTGTIGLLPPGGIRYSPTGTTTTLSSEGIYYGEPVNFTEVLESFRRLPLVMCHFASAFWDERVEMAQRYPNLYFDISGGFNAPDVVARDGRRAIVEEDAVRIICKVGAHRIMFGTDGPLHMAQPAIEQILRLSLTEEEKRMILAENAKRIYKI